MVAKQTQIEQLSMNQQGSPIEESNLCVNTNRTASTSKQANAAN